jgi:hypothetical protein
VIADPLLDGEENVRIALLGPGVPVMVDANGTPGVADILFETLPSPTPFTALIINVYSVPFVRFENDIGVVVAAGSRATHVVPLSSEYL